MMTRNDIVYPTQSFAYISINSWSTIFPTANAPSNDACLHIRIRIILGEANQWTASISFASVLPLDTSSTKEGIMEFVSPSKSRGLQFGFTLLMTDNRQVNFFEDNLVFPSRAKFVLTPAGGETCGTIEHFIWLWKADGVDMTSQSKVVVKVAIVKLWMNVDVLDIPVLVRISL